MPILDMMYKGENEYSKMVQINETEKLNTFKDKKYKCLQTTSI